MEIATVATGDDSNLDQCIAMNLNNVGVCQLGLGLIAIQELVKGAKHQ
jgi:hypothetical protein